MTMPHDGALGIDDGQARQLVLAQRATTSSTDVSGETVTGSVSMISLTSSATGATLQKALSAVRAARRSRRPPSRGRRRRRSAAARPAST